MTGCQHRGVTAGMRVCYWYTKEKITEHGTVRRKQERKCHKTGYEDVGALRESNLGCLNFGTVLGPSGSRTSAFRHFGCRLFDVVRLPQPHNIKVHKIPAQHDEPESSSEMIDCYTKGAMNYNQLKIELVNPSNELTKAFEVGEGKKASLTPTGALRESGSVEPGTPRIHGISTQNASEAKRIASCLCVKEGERSWMKRKQIENATKTSHQNAGALRESNPGPLIFIKERESRRPPGVEPDTSRFSGPSLPIPTLPGTVTRNPTRERMTHTCACARIGLGSGEARRDVIGGRVISNEGDPGERGASSASACGDPRICVCAQLSSIEEGRGGRESCAAPVYNDIGMNTPPSE
ncbi:hypothetical protein B0H16DRAFT_1452791 [Mycena metata]|uniref:Uncharacterized protein n=1 Tax=Mycena metata TaxID=1033252 RepID=A0AAD7JSX9_9AGAR|nr:hypothetical protein B0H16DRAFT_1452791 [Mycena metata]